MSRSKGNDAPLAKAMVVASAAAVAPFFPFAPIATLYVFLFALAHAFLIAAPLYYGLSRTRRLTLPACLLGGFLVAAVPITLMSISLAVSVPPGTDAWADGVWTVKNGRYTYEGWIGVFTTGAGFGVLGLLGGAAFWIVMRRHSAPRGLRP